MFFFCAGTRETLQLTIAMGEVGADAALITTPSFFKSRMNSAAMMKHYTTVSHFTPLYVSLQLSSVDIGCSNISLGPFVLPGVMIRTGGSRDGEKTS